MSGPLLQHPEWLAPAAGALVAVAAALVVGALAARRRGRMLLGRRAPAAGTRADMLLLAALVALAAALVGPRIGQREVRTPAGGADVVVLLDASWSMRASDTPPSRLARARRAAEAVLARLAPGDRAALAAFAGHGVLLTPLTADAAALAELLPGIDAGLVGAGGSDAGDGIRRALEAFAGAPAERPRAILLLSDGEDPAHGDAGEAAALAARAGVRVVTAAIGSDAGAVLAELPPGAARPGTVISRRDAAALAALARATGGAAFEADAWGDLDAGALAAALLPAGRDAGGGVSVRRVPAVRVAPLAALAFVVLALEWLGAGGRLRRGAGTLAVVAAAAATVGAGPGDEPPLPPTPEPAALEAHLRGHPGDPEALVWLGLARAERGELAEAERAFAAAALLARDPELAALAFDDLGVTALAQGRLERARDAFFAALALDPGRRRAIYNLEWTLAALAARPPEPEEGGGERSEEPGPSEPEAPRDDESTPESDAPEAGAEIGGERREDADAARAGSAGAAPELSESEARRWLESAPDDPARALRAAAARVGEARPRREGPGW